MPREVLDILRGLSGLDVIGGDVVEVAPQYDANTTTAQNGAQMLFEILCLIAQNPKRKKPKPMTMSQLPEIAGILGAVLTTACWVPQAVQTIRTRDTAGLSLAMYATLLIGLALWLVYAMSIMSWPLIVSNIATGVLAFIILVLKIRHG